VCFFATIYLWLFLLLGIIHASHNAFNCDRYMKRRTQPMREARRGVLRYERVQTGAAPSTTTTTTRVATSTSHTTVAAAAMGLAALGTSNLPSSKVMKPRAIPWNAVPAMTTPTRTRMNLRALMGLPPASPSRRVVPPGDVDRMFRYMDPPASNMSAGSYSSVVFAVLAGDDTNKLLALKVVSAPSFVEVEDGGVIVRRAPIEGEHIFKTNRCNNTGTGSVTSSTLEREELARDQRPYVIKDSNIVPMKGGVPHIEGPEFSVEREAVMAHLIQRLLDSGVTRHFVSTIGALNLQALKAVEYDGPCTGIAGVLLAVDEQDPCEIKTQSEFSDGTHAAGDVAASPSCRHLTDMTGNAATRTVQLTRCMLVMESCKFTLHDLITGAWNAYISNDIALRRRAQIIVVTALIQACHALYCASKAFGFRHNDLHGNNIGIVLVPRQIETYVVDGVEVSMDNCGIAAKIIDFGRCTASKLFHPRAEEMAAAAFGYAMFSLSLKHKPHRIHRYDSSFDVAVMASELYLVGLGGHFNPEYPCTLSGAFWDLWGIHEKVCRASVDTPAPGRVVYPPLNARAIDLLLLHPMPEHYPDKVQVVEPAWEHFTRDVDIAGMCGEHATLTPKPTNPAASPESPADDKATTAQAIQKLNACIDLMQTNIARGIHVDSALSRFTFIDDVIKALSEL
jgi:hypothetical protein